jgi:hypothetical protein
MYVTDRLDLLGDDPGHTSSAEMVVEIDDFHCLDRKYST